eukprot:XP_001610041.1 hypothetical protein [Babesia bovis T2Bo]
MASIKGARMPSGLMDSSFNTGIKKPVATADQLDGLYFREKEGPKHGSIDLGDVAYELCQLDASLDELFREADTRFTTHQQIHKFRLRVSRRISAFAAICRKLLKCIEMSSSSPDALKLKSFHMFYMERLMRHKINLSEWWSRNERDYHSMCLSSYVSEAESASQLDEDIDYDTSVTSNESELVQKLKATRNMMLNQIKQMNDTESSMLKSSTYISRQAEILQVLKQRFGTARQLFVSVRRKTDFHYLQLTRFALTAPFKIVNLLLRFKH